MLKPPCSQWLLSIQYTVGPMALSRLFCALSRAKVEGIQLLGHGQLSVIRLIGHEPSPLPHTLQTKHGTNFIGNSLTPSFLSHFPATHSLPHSSDTFRNSLTPFFLSHSLATHSLSLFSNEFHWQFTHSLFPPTLSGNSLTPSFLSHFPATHSLPLSSHTLWQLTRSLFPVTHSPAPAMSPVKSNLHL